MAKVTNTVEAAPETEAEQVELVDGIIDFTEVAKPNKYTERVQKLIDAGEGKADRLVVPTEGAQKEKLEYQNAANALDKTARVVGSKDGVVAGDKTAYTFILKAKYNKPKLGPRKPKDETVTDAPVEVAPDAQ